MSVLNYFTKQYATAQRKQTSVFSLVITAVFGGIFLAVGLAMLFAPSDRSATTTGVVAEVQSVSTDDGTMYSPVIEYEVAGESYRFTRSIRTSFSPEIGESYEVAYDPADPADGAIAKGLGTIEFWFPMIFVLIGGVVIGAKLYSFITSHKRTKEIERLQAAGQPLSGVLIEVAPYNGVMRSSRNGRSQKPQFQLVVAATSPEGEVKNYTSDVLIGVPGGLMGLDFQSAAVPIDVYVDPANHENYYVDLSDIPELTPERLQQMITNAQSAASASVAVPHTLAQSAVPPTAPSPANPELVAYVREQRTAGYSDADINAMLRNAGWGEEDVQRAVS